MLEFRILGPLEVADGGRPVPLGGASLRALLGLLLLHANEVVSSDRLLDELWTGEPPPSGVTALQVRVSQLRKALGPAGARLETKPPGYVLRLSPEEFDLDRFTRLLDQAVGTPPAAAAATLRDALALWRGPALADLGYESFAAAAIVRLEELRLAAVERRIDADLALGRHDDIVGELEQLVAEHPQQERLQGQLMLALYRSGRQGEALAAYQTARRSLLDALGIEPGPAVRELQHAILRHDPELQLARPERSILVSSFDNEGIARLLALAEPLGRQPPKELILTQVVERAEQLAPAAVELERHRSNLLERGVSARSGAFVSRAPAEDLVRFAIEQDVDLVFVRGPRDPLSDPLLLQLLAKAPCDVAVLVGEPSPPGPVLVPFVGADHDWAAVELGAWLAAALDVPLRLAGPGGDGSRDDASRLLANASLAVQRTLGVAPEPVLVEPGAPALLAAAGEAAVVVVGLRDRWQRHGLGNVRGALVAGAGAQVVLVRRGLRPGGLAPGESRTRFTWSIKA